MDLFNSWKIDNNSNTSKLIEFLIKISRLHETNITYLLNMDNIENVIEKTVYDIASFHLKNLNMDIDNKYIEFWFKSATFDKTTMCHIDCDEYDKSINNNPNYNTPLLSCVTYLNDNCHAPTLLMDIDEDDYKYKSFENKKLIFSFPKKYKQITFDGGKYFHGITYLNSEDQSDRDLLVINFWDVKPLNVPYFDYSTFFFKYTMKYKYVDDLFSYRKYNDNLVNIIDNNENIVTISLHDKNILNTELFESILFNTNGNMILFENFKKIFQENNDNDTFVFENIQGQITSKKNDCDCKSDGKVIDVKNISKFNQRFIHEKHFTKDICKWIINECDEYALENGWTTNRHNLYPTTDIPVEKIQSIFKFIITSFSETIIHKLKKNYQIDDTIKISISDLFVVKYEYDQQSYLELHADTSCISVNILLSDVSEFKGGGTFFEDNLTISLNQGDMLIHSSKTKHSGLQITSGKRYVLIFFIDLYE